MNAATNALVPEYVASMGDGTEPANDPIFRIKPRFLDLPRELAGYFGK